MSIKAAIPSSTKYLIWVSTYTQEYCLYTGSAGKWKLLRTAKIATGKAASPTATHICKIRGREERWTYENGTYQAPVVYFYGKNAFHSRLHNPDGFDRRTEYRQACLRRLHPDV